MKYLFICVLFAFFIASTFSTHEAAKCSPKCKFGSICKNGRCVNLCSNKKCPTNKKCLLGLCLPKCQPTCPPTHICIIGKCISKPQPCTITCQSGQICFNNKCVTIPIPTCNPKCDSRSICKNGKCQPI